jgi:dipeptidyl aminopeptidase/acylaminoacyl peptidase
VHLRLFCRGYCEIRFAPDGSAFVRTSQARDGFEVVRSDGVLLAGLVHGDHDPMWSPAGGWIASGCDPASGCSIMHPDGSGRQALPGVPSWSPREQVLAVAAPDGTLLVGHGDGSGLRPIGAIPLPSSWSPDGSTFAFVRDGDAWLALSDGSQTRNLTRFPLGGATGAWWSPDGRWVAVLQGTTMWAVSPDGSVRHRLGSGLGPGDGRWGLGWAPAWSPDGTWLAIEHVDPAGEVGSQAQEVTLIHAGDWSAVRLTNAFQPVWSLDGRHLAVAADDGNGRYVADVMNADGTGRTTVWTDSDAATPRLYPPVAWVP